MAFKRHVNLKYSTVIAALSFGFLVRNNLLIHVLVSKGTECAILPYIVVVFVVCNYAVVNASSSIFS